MLIYLSNFSISFNRSSSEIPLVDHWSVLNNFFATFDSWLLLYWDIYLLATGWIMQEDFWGGVTVWLFGGVVGGIGGTFSCGKHSKHGNGASNFWSSSNFLLSSLNFCTMLKSTFVSIIFFSVINSLCNFVISLHLCINSMLSKFKDVSVFSIVMYSLNPVIIV